MRFQGQVKRRRKIRKGKLVPLLIPAILIAVVFFFYLINMRLTPTYVRYAEVQTVKIASHVINQAISTRIANILDVNDIIEHVPTETSEMVTTKFNTEIINRVLADTRNLVELHLQQAEAGNLEVLPETDNIEYDPEKMEDQGGVVFFVPMGQAANIPLLGNMGPKIPIRFHIIGDVQANVVASIEEFGINNAYIEVNILLRVNVQIIIPLATKSSVVEQKIPVAIGLVQGPVPHIFSQGAGAELPSIEVPLTLPDVK
ncbi:sporulation protein YunB [Sporosarcina sp. G11-34]|uniref:sporulation protein YunB n=1 Tax=Sporosarcina sp. G11-34 TaxID=2849605 RepID=UPI0022A8E92F|nr:sporulation protein YunB [Sporosarcina sp. G11-34]MCZ2260466.1 sporulation protein YunB [Sporosarcina sp. G11-34]